VKLTYFIQGGKMIIKAAVFKLQNETVAVAIAPTKFVDNHAAGDNLIYGLERLLFHGMQVVLVSRAPGRGWVYYGRRDLMDTFNREDIPIETMPFKDYSVDIPGM
jgi:hypothetical protein